MRAMRAYDEAKARLAKAEERMDRAVTMAGGWKQWDGEGFIHIPFFGNTEEWIIEAISEMKAAHKQWTDLFIDWETENEAALHDAQLLGRMANEILRSYLEDKNGN